MADKLNISPAWGAATVVALGALALGYAAAAHLSSTSAAGPVKCRESAWVQVSPGGWECDPDQVVTVTVERAKEHVSHFVITCRCLPEEALLP